MLTTREEAKKIILDEMGNIETAPFAVDYIEELADSYCPIYTNDVIAQWTALPSEWSNRFWEITTPVQDTPIEHLMSADLWIYYRDLFMTVYNEILDEQESEEN